MPRARTSACCAPCRRSSTRASRKPVLIGRPGVIEQRLGRLGLRLKPKKDFEIVDPDDDPRFDDYWTLYHGLMERKGVTPDLARNIVRTRNTVIAALMVRRGDAEAMICGTSGAFDAHLKHLLDVIGLRRGVRQLSALTAVILPKGTFFVCDTHVMPDPTRRADRRHDAAGDRGDTALRPRAPRGPAVPFQLRFRRHAQRPQDARGPGADPRQCAGAGGRGRDERDNWRCRKRLRLRLFPNSRLKGQPNLLVMPTLDAANIAVESAALGGRGAARSGRC